MSEKAAAMNKVPFSLRSISGQFGGCKRMSLEAIKAISEAEEKARLTKAEAAAISKKLIEEAEEKGVLAIEDAKKKAEEEIRDLKRRAGDKAREDARELSRKTENRKASMLVKADGRMDKAVSLVIERIVNS